MRSWLGAISMGVVMMGCGRAPDCPPTRTPAPTELRGEDHAPAEASVILLVRHAEKAADGTPDPPLTERGVRRAECLARLLGGFEPTHLLATQYQRTAATLEPLAAAAGLEVVVMPAQDGAAWERALTQLPPGARAVVAGHSNTLPAWVVGLGGRLDGLDAKGNIPDDEYGRLIHVVSRGSDQVTSYTTAYCTE